MTQPRICPNCRATVPADAPAGACPACALRAGFATGEGPDSPTRAASTRSAPLPAEELARRIPELEQFELIGRGGMGAVYKARHRNLARPVAVKVLDAALSNDPAFAERFAREARTLAQLDHPNIVAVHDFGQRDGLYYLIMELVDGINLRQTIESGGLEPSEALIMVPRICEALQYAHDQGVVHRDIKPENILVDRKGSIKIADFGLAKLVAGDAARRLTEAEQIMGTPNYMAPEQIEHPGDVDHRADIFALGVVFYELLTGELPIGRFAPPSQKVQIDVRLDEVVLRTLEKEPGLRYQQASQLKLDIESVASGDYRAADKHDPSKPSPSKSGPGTGYEYRSSATLFGLPLVHVAFSGGGGKRMRLAHGVIAIGDAAFGVVAVGFFGFGGITLGLVAGVGFVSFGGVAAGLLTALGGVSIGGFAFGAISIGLLAQGAVPLAGLHAAGRWAMLIGWLTMAAGVTVGLLVAGYAWIRDAAARDSQRR